MTAVTAQVSAAGDAADQNPYILPEHLTDGHGERGPRFWDAVWDFGPFVPRTTGPVRINFGRLPDLTAQTAAREYLLSRITRAVPTPGRSRSAPRPMKITWVQQEFDRYAAIVEDLGKLGVNRLSQATPAVLDALVQLWRAERQPVPKARANATARRDRSRLDRPSRTAAVPIKPGTIATRITVLKHMAEHRQFVTADALTFLPWPGRTAKQVAQYVPADSEENSTPRIPEPIMAPLLRAAVFYVTTASTDILAARVELEHLDAAHQARGRLPKNEAGNRIRAFIARRRAQGRGIPALPVAQRVLVPDAPIVDGVLQSPNLALIAQLAGVAGAKAYSALLRLAADELGYEDGGLDTPMSPWPDTGRPWRSRLSRRTLHDEVFHLRVACWIVIAYLSGMRDTEVRELGRDCAFTVQAQDGRTRYMLHGKVLKGRKLTGEEADWVVLDIVHDAVRILLQINDDPTHLFGYRSQMGTDKLLDALPPLLDDFRDHVDDLFSTPEARYVPDHEQVKWYFTTRQFRRTLAWHIAHQPFGVVAGTRQYKHAHTAMFEGYAGTSASGFAAEVAAEEAVAMLDYLEELYHDWDSGHAATGGAAGRIDSEFDRIRRELGDLPGVVADASRLRKMLGHLAKTLHPGVLNDCFFQAAAAVCVKRAKIIGRPVPQHNMCLRCPNARRSTVHLPRLIAARDQAIDLQKECQCAGPVPMPQEVTITNYIAELDQIIMGLEANNLEPAT